ncbi:P-II family nitrogen regulator [Palaeococcus ferrophilus]|uniref:P-II family nitrogen regulator n=1 Tax=Palaeococcus ferrophilus TaxID=83868 RepID=UPI00064E57D7|nr:P-II family nitrogen regulator [Palaeococcus ferrophilus]
MKKIEAILREDDFERVKNALKEAGFVPLTAYPVKGRGVQGGVPPYDMLAKMKVEIVAKDEDVPVIVSIIVEKARRGIPGDGKIFVLPVEEAIRIRTGETGDKALY